MSIFVDELSKSDAETFSFWSFFGQIDDGPEAAKLADGTLLRALRNRKSCVRCKFGAKFPTTSLKSIETHEISRQQFKQTIINNN